MTPVWLKETRFAGPLGWGAGINQCHHELSCMGSSLWMGWPPPSFVVSRTFFCTSTIFDSFEVRNQSDSRVRTNDGLFPIQLTLQTPTRPYRGGHRTWIAWRHPRMGIWGTAKDCNVYLHVWMRLLMAPNHESQLVEGSLVWPLKVRTSLQVLLLLVIIIQ